MNTKLLGLSLMALSVAAAGGIAATATVRNAAADARAARIDAAKASKAIARHKAAAAVKWGEAAVALAPQVASYRATLGQAYLLAGRFTSARSALSDALTLDPANGKVALNLALAQIAAGDLAGARGTLDAGATIIPVADRGLALALAGDPAAAVELLLPAARGDGADAKLRQNLALSLALAGRWKDAQLIAAMDLPPAEVDQRIQQWSQFARPAGKSDQVAALLGVTPASDPGMPTALALDATAPAAGLATADPVDGYLPEAPSKDRVDRVTAETGVPATAPEAAPALAADTAPAPDAAPATAAGTVVFGPRAEVVQPLPAAAPVAQIKAGLIAAPKTPVKAAPVRRAMSMAKPAKGGFFVQLGAFENAAVARVGWARAAGAYPALAAAQPLGMSATVNGRNFYRVSVGGFDRAGADALCAGYRARGGRCFVRASAGEQIADWAKKGPQVASR